jgi:hypothetical protein
MILEVASSTSALTVRRSTIVVSRRIRCGSSQMTPTPQPKLQHPEGAPAVGRKRTGGTAASAHMDRKADGLETTQLSHRDCCGHFPKAAVRQLLGNFA